MARSAVLALQVPLAAALRCDTKFGDFKISHFLFEQRWAICPTAAPNQLHIIAEPLRVLLLSGIWEEAYRRMLVARVSDQPRTHRKTGDPKREMAA